MIGGDFELLNSRFLVAVDSSEAEEKLLNSRQTPDDVIRRAQAKIRIGGVRRDYQQFLGVLIRFTDLFQAVELTLIDKTGVVCLHSQAQRHGEEGVRVVRV